MWHCVIIHVVPDVSKDCGASIFRIKQFFPVKLLNPEDEGTKILQNAKTTQLKKQNHQEMSLQESYSFLTALLEVVRLSVFASTVFQKMTQFPPSFEGQSKVIYDTGPLSEPVMNRIY